MEASVLLPKETLRKTKESLRKFVFIQEASRAVSGFLFVLNRLGRERAREAMAGSVWPNIDPTASLHVIR